MFTNPELINIHVRALFTHDTESRLLSVNEPDNAVTPAPRLFLGRTHEGNVWRFRADLSEELCEELDALCADEPPLKVESNEPPRHFEAFVRLLGSDLTVENSSNGLTYQFVEDGTPSNALIAVTEDNAEVLHGGFEKLIEELPA